MTTDGSAERLSSDMSIPNRQSIQAAPAGAKIQNCYNPLEHQKQLSDAGTANLHSQGG